MDIKIKLPNVTTTLEIDRDSKPRDIILETNGILQFRIIDRDREEVAISLNREEALNLRNALDFIVNSNTLDDL